MGKRVEGKKKPKSIKSKATNMNSKRKLSKMGKNVKKGHAGNIIAFISRTRAIKKLQITLRDFRRLCILKGVYPRDPKKSPNGKSKTYYNIKDIYFLAHEPLLHKFREFKAFMKKVRKFASKKEFGKAREMEKKAPKYRLDHLVRERYPDFSDAVRDLDDALSMIHLFSRLPSESKIGNVNPALCATLSREWQYYVAHTNSLKKTFVSIKGIYYQSEICGETTTWVVPHEFTQEIPSDVDFRVMNTFLEFYTVFLRFCMFKLYHDAGLSYPPQLSSAKDAAGVYLEAIKVETLDEKSEKEAIAAISEMTGAVDEAVAQTVEKSELRLSSLAAKLSQIEAADDDEEEEDSDNEEEDKTEGSDNKEEEEESDEKYVNTYTKKDSKSVLFSNLRFFVSREVPRQSVEFVVKSFGGMVGWEGEGSPYTFDDESITHFICDRPMSSDALLPGREYLQPQWVFDSINSELLLPVARYLPGASLPPHLSPFVNDKFEGYTPQYKEQIDQLKSAYSVTGDASSAGVTDVTENEVAEANDNESEDDDDETKFKRELEAEISGVSYSESMGGEVANNVSEEEEEEDTQVEGKTNKMTEKKRKRTEEEKDAESMKKIMMSKKAKRLHGRMLHGIAKKEEKIEKLKSKRKSLNKKSVK